MSESEQITTGIHRNGQHWAKAFDVEGVGDTPAYALDALRANLFERSRCMEELAESIVVEWEDAE